MLLIFERSVQKKARGRGEKREIMTKVGVAKSAFRYLLLYSTIPTYLLFSFDFMELRCGMCDIFITAVGEGSGRQNQRRRSIEFSAEDYAGNPCITL